MTPDIEYLPPARTLLTGLAMVESARWHDGRLWFLNSGTGELCCTDLRQTGYTVVSVLPGFLRGLCFVGGQDVFDLSGALLRQPPGIQG